MQPFFPEQVFFEEQALDYKLGEELWQLFAERRTPRSIVESHNKVRIDEEDPRKRFIKAKKTLVVGVKKDLRFQSCRPSADYRLVTTTSCPGKCQYCYLATNLGERVYLRIYVNLNEILAKVDDILEKSDRKVTTFEASSSSDPIATEHLTGSLARIISFFGKRNDARLRVVTKFDYIDSILGVAHNQHTRFRFSLNAREVIRKYEHGTANLEERLQAAKRILEDGYPIGFILAPLMVFPGWRDQYRELVSEMAKYLGSQQAMTIELIMHRFTTRAKRVIKKRFPGSSLEMDKELREHKGFGKYVYPEDQARELSEYLQSLIDEYLPGAEVEYFT
ncbi:MAG: spore photoproduct lyase [Halanaerobium sp.]|nr:spore photoproduct lyase [Halanaerobium sp.]